MLRIVHSHSKLFLETIPRSRSSIVHPRVCKISVRTVFDTDKVQFLNMITGNGEADSAIIFVKVVRHLLEDC